MITRFGLAPRKPGLTAAQFQEHWRTAHAAVVRGMPGLVRYWQNHAVLRDGEPLLPWPGFDACAQIDAESLVDFDRAFGSEHYQGPVREDERRFVDGPRGGYVLSERVAVDGDVDPDGIRLLTFMRLAPLGSMTALADALKAAGPAAGSRARELFLSQTGGSLGGQRFSLFDAVEALWFETPEQAEQYVRSAAARERRDIVAHLVRGTERLIARVNRAI
jgi:uncharacterized protein (TIGR02118 family)